MTIEEIYKQGYLDGQASVKEPCPKCDHYDHGHYTSVCLGCKVFGENRFRGKK